MDFLHNTLVGQSPTFKRMLHLLQRVAQVDVPVLIKGETGTGKELAARAIHYTSQRRQGPFVPLNCGSLPDNLVESELYGHERGAFTDARDARAGLVAAAEGGTLFLDEIDSLPARAQVSLLRFLQDHTYRSVGGNKLRSGNVRIVAAASPRLERLLRDGQFRDDLAFRLDVFALDMPPLRERGDDVLLLARHFIARHARHHGVAARELSAHSMTWMRRHAWPGNVRELDNCVQRALLLSEGPELELAGTASTELSAPALAPEQALQSYNSARDEALHTFERNYLAQLMALNAGNVTHAARMAGKERRNLGRLLKKHGLEHGAH